MLAYIMSHSGQIMSVLSAIVVVDHSLASTDLVASNSSLQALLAAVSKVADLLMGLLKPKQ